MTAASLAAEAEQVLTSDAVCQCERTDCVHGQAKVAEATAYALIAVARQLADIAALLGGIRDEIKAVSR